LTPVTEIQNLRRDRQRLWLDHAVQAGVDRDHLRRNYRRIQDLHVSRGSAPSGIRAELGMIALGPRFKKTDLPLLPASMSSGKF